MNNSVLSFNSMRDYYVFLLSSHVKDLKKMGWEGVGVGGEGVLSCRGT